MKQRVPLLLVLILFFFFIYAKIQLYEPLGTPLKEWIHSNGDQKDVTTLPAYSTTNQPGLHTFEYTIDTLEEKNLVIPQIYGYAYKLYFNDVFITGIGNFENPTANLWTYAQHVDLSTQPLLSTNTIRFDIYALHDIGFSAIPFLTDESSALKRVAFLNLLNHDLILLIMGFALAFSFLLIFLSFKIKQRKSVYVNYGIALFLFALYSLEFTYRSTSGSIDAYLLLRKILLMSIYSAGYFLLIAQRSYFLEKKTSLIIALIYNSPLLFMMFSQTFVEIYKVQSLLNIVSLVTILYIAAIGFIKRYRDTLVPNIILVVTALHTILNLFFELMQPYILHLGIMVFLFGLCTIIVMDFQIIERENKKLGEISIKDPLTKAFNRSVIKSLTCNPDDYVVFIDLDRFKAYNDTYGHQQGDQLLKDIVVIFERHVRKSDCVIRYGGDEFILFFKSCPENVVIATLKLIKSKIQTLGDIDISYGISPCKDSIENTIVEADHLMYEMKNRNRNDLL